MDIRNPPRYLLMKNELHLAAHFSNCPEHFLRYRCFAFNLFEFFSGIRQLLHLFQFICRILQAKMCVGVQRYANVRPIKY